MIFTDNKHDIDNHINGQKVVFEHFGNRKNASKYPKKPMRPQRLTNIPLILLLDHKRRQIPRHGTKQVQQTYILLSSLL